jgi:hypothetical protein
MKRVDLERIAVRAAGIIGDRDCLLVGGLAVGAYGYVRATDDVDFVTRIPLKDACEHLKAHGVPAQLRRGGALEGDFPCVSASVDGIRVDVMPPLVALDWEKAIELPMGRRARLLLVDLAGLIRLKTRAGGPRDLMDVAALVLQHPEHLDFARALATAYRAEDRLAMWLEDPRLRQEVVRAGRSKPPRVRAARTRRSP